jgi:alcohol dehydrogenase
MACLDPKVAAKIAILDPELTLSQPRKVAACTGIDAIAHAVESAVTTRRTAISQLFSRQAYRLCAESLPRVFAEPDTLEARGRMQLGAAFAGAAIENSMLGAAHAAANPLTARFGIVHGAAVGLLLPHVVRFNGTVPGVQALYAELLDADGPSPAEMLAGQIEELLSITGLAGSLGQWGAQEDAIPALAEEASSQWTAQFNPRPVGPAEFRQLYAAAFAPGRP